MGSGRKVGGGRVRLNWEIFSWFVLEKAKINEKEVACLKENIIREYSTYVSSIKSSMDRNSKLREELLGAFKGAQREKAQIVSEIERISIKYSLIKESLENNKIKQQEDIEAILKKEFDLRLHKIELENLEIKISQAHSLILSSSELLHNHLGEEDMELEDHLNKLNSKFTNYLNMMAGVGDTRSPAIKRHFEEEVYLEPAPELAPQPTSDLDFLLAKYTGRRKCELSFKNYLIDVVNLFKELSNSHN